MKKIIILLIISVLSISLSSEELTKVGVVDISKIYNRYIKESADARKLEIYLKDVEDQISQRSVEIDHIEQELTKARDDDNEALITELETDLKIKRQNRQEYSKHKKREYEAMISSESTKSEFSEKLVEAIKQIGLQKGFSVILRKSDPDMIWYHNDVDITDLVIQNLMN